MVRGNIRFAGKELLGLKAEERRRIRSRSLAYVPQDASACLSPWKTIRKQLQAFWKLTSPEPGIAVEQAVTDALQAVALDSRMLEKYPAQLSIRPWPRGGLAHPLFRRPRLHISDRP